MKQVVLDASAVITFLENRPGSEHVDQLFQRALFSRVRLLMSLVNWGEVYYSLWRIRGRGVADIILADLEELPIEFNSPDRELTRIAAGLRAEYKLPYADCFAAALAIHRKAGVATADYDFKQVEHLVNILWLMKN